MYQNKFFYKIKEFGTIFFRFVTFYHFCEFCHGSALDLSFPGNRLLYRFCIFNFKTYKMFCMEGDNDNTIKNRGWTTVSVLFKL